MTSLQIGKLIYSLLLENPEISGQVGERIFPIVADIETRFPFIIYKRINIDTTTSKDRYTHSESVDIEIIIASESYNKSIGLAEIVRSVLEGKKLEYEGFKVQDIRLTGASEDYTDDTFIQNLTFNIQLNR